MTDAWETEGGAPEHRVRASEHEHECMPGCAVCAGEWPPREREHSQRGIATYERVPSRVQARDEPCQDPEHCDLPGHKQPLNPDGSIPIRRRALALTEPVPYLTDAQGVLGSLPTRALLEELRLRGDLAMTVMPTTPRGADGAHLSSSAGLLLLACANDTLNAVRGS